MQRSILVVSPDIDFIQQIRSHLEEGGRFRVTSSTNAQEALTISSQAFFDVAILDAEINDVPFVPFTRDMVAIQPDLKILVFPLGNNPHHPALTGLVSNGFLNKPFFGPEVGNALTTLFTEVEVEPQVVVKEVDDYANLWVQHPEIGAKRIEQMVGTTSASTGLLIMHGQVIAGSGSTDDVTISNVVGFLNRYWKDGENSELVRFLRMEGDTREYLIYATKLINHVVLTLIYSPNTSIQKVRNEVALLKKEFQQVYPNTGALRKDLETKVEEEPLSTNEFYKPEFEAASDAAPAETVETIENENEDEVEPVLDEAQLQSLDALLAKMPPPDPILTDDSTVPPLPISELETPTWVGGLESTEKEVQPVPEQEQVESGEQIVEEMANFDSILHEAEAAILTESLIETQENNEVEEISVEVSESPVEETENGEINEFSEPESEILDETKTETSDQSTENDFADLVFEEEETQQAVVVEETPSEDNLQKEVETEEQELTELPPSLDSTQSTDVEEQNLDESGESEAVALPDFDFKLPWETDNVADGSNLQENEPLEGLQEGVDDTEVLPFAADPLTQMGSGVEAESENVPPPLDLIEKEETTSSVASVFEETLETYSADQAQEEPIDKKEDIEPAVIHKEPGTTPLGLKGFRFAYTCVLIPNESKQFLARDLSERLSFILPQIHLAEGWRLTGIAVRPLYLSWSLTLPLTVCPTEIIDTISAKTQSHLFSNFPDIAEKYSEKDFWSRNFLIISGSEPPSLNLIQDFIMQTRKLQDS